MSSNSSISTTRARILLRPLRNKCAALKNSFKCSTRPVVTYGTNSAGYEDIPPLEIPTNIHQQKEALELSRRIHAVKDCFRNVVHASRPPSDYTCQNKPAVISLANMCASIVGQNMPCTLEPEDIEDQLVANEIHDLYDAIPLHYRSWAIVSHSLELILTTCPHHPSLLSSLLDICLAANLAYHSELVARALLEVAFVPHNSNARICHPAHSAYLFDICDLWVQNGLREQTFVRLVVQSLIASKAHKDVWTSKALSKLARHLSKRDLASFILILNASLQALGSDLPSKEDTVVRRRHIAYRLYKWCKTLFVSPETLQPDLSGAVEFLHTAVAESNDIQIHGVAISLVTHFLDFLQGPALDVATDILMGCSPVTATFNDLIIHIFNDIPALSNATPIRSRHDRLIYYTQLLRSRGLLRLEASLFACALYHVEHPDPESGVYIPANAQDLAIWKDQLIDLVAEAERRCFTGTAVVSKSQDSEWEWDTTFGSWVRKADVCLPPAKKAKTIDNRRFSKRLSALEEENVSLKNDSQLNLQSRRSFGSTMARRRSSAVHENFACLLATAMSNRTVLHRKRNHEVDTPSPSRLACKHQSFPFSPMENINPRSRSPSPVEFEPATSDDALLLC